MNDPPNLTLFRDYEIGAWVIPGHRRTTASHLSISRGLSALERHGTVNHSAEEYVRAAFWHTNTVENYFSIFKRGIMGTYYHISETHLHRYAAEFDFRYNHRSALGYSDMDRTEAMMRQIGGKRLTYRRTGRPQETEEFIPF
jgi:ISXO2-like transposase domain